MCLPFLAAPAGAQEPAGKDLYAMYCTQCHGTQGNGKGLNAARMSVQPRSHIDRAEMIARTDEELFKVIEQGGGSIDKSILMPAWGGNLSKENRSEEHTSELQSRENLVCRLLLEKKKKNNE